MPYSIAFCGMYATPINNKNNMKFGTLQNKHKIVHNNCILCTVSGTSSRHISYVHKIKRRQCISILMAPRDYSEKSVFFNNLYSCYNFTSAVAVSPMVDFQARLIRLGCSWILRVYPVFMKFKTGSFQGILKCNRKAHRTDVMYSVLRSG